MEELIINNYRDYIGRTILDWQITDCVEMPTLYLIVIKKNNVEKFFHIRRTIIKGNVLNLNEDVYELRYKDFEDSALLNTNDILNIDVVISKMIELIQKYN
jgi:hypothetical protein